MQTESTSSRIFISLVSEQKLLQDKIYEWSETVIVYNLISCHHKAQTNGSVAAVVSHIMPNCPL